MLEPEHTYPPERLMTLASCLEHAYRHLSNVERLPEPTTIDRLPSNLVSFHKYTHTHALSNPSFWPHSSKRYNRPKTKALFYLTLLHTRLTSARHRLTSDDPLASRSQSIALINIHKHTYTVCHRDAGRYGTTLSVCAFARGTSTRPSHQCAM